MEHSHKFKLSSSTSKWWKSYLWNSIRSWSNKRLQQKKQKWNKKLKYSTLPYLKLVHKVPSTQVLFTTQWVILASLIIKLLSNCYKVTKKSQGAVCSKICCQAEAVFLTLSLLVEVRTMKTHIRKSWTSILIRTIIIYHLSSTGRFPFY